MVSPGRVHPARRGHRPDRADRRLGARRGVPPGARLAGPRASSSWSATTPHRRSWPSPASPGASASAWPRTASAPGRSASRSSSRRSRTRRGGARARAPGRARRAHLDRRLRRGLLVAHPPAPPHRPHAQARPGVPRGRARTTCGAPAFITAMLGLAGHLGLHVVAEGIETEEQLAFLRSEACGFGQGYHLARPMPAAEVTDCCFRPRRRVELLEPPRHVAVAREHAAAGTRASPWRRSPPPASRPCPRRSGPRRRRRGTRTAPTRRA